jgi:hypothetical protein
LVVTNACRLRLTPGEKAVSIVHAQTVQANRVTTGPGKILLLEPATFHQAFGQRPFLIRHNLAGHTLLQLPRLVELARQLPGHRVEYNAGTLDVNTDPKATPHTGLSIEETIRRIEECSSWMVLKNVELVPEYRELLHACLAEVETLDHPAGRGVTLREGFVFVSSPGAVTPYHMDPELNFLVQIHGSKQMSVFPGSDRELLSEVELEHFYGGAHRNLVFKEEYQQKATVFELRPGDGLHVPVNDPHWVKVGPGYSISFSITVITRATERRGTLYRLNHRLRQKGRTPRPVGQAPLRDWWRYNLHRVGARLARLWPGRRAGEKPASSEPGA